MRMYSFVTGYINLWVWTVGMVRGDRTPYDVVTCEVIAPDYVSDLAIE